MVHFPIVAMDYFSINFFFIIINFNNFTIILWFFVEKI